MHLRKISAVQQRVFEARRALGSNDFYVDLVSIPHEHRGQRRGGRAVRFNLAEWDY